MKIGMMMFRRRRQSVMSNRLRRTNSCSSRRRSSTNSINDKNKNIGMAANSLYRVLTMAEIGTNPERSSGMKVERRNTAEVELHCSMKRIPENNTNNSSRSSSSRSSKSNINNLHWNSHRKNSIWNR